jgi:hypothetical protein
MLLLCVRVHRQRTNSETVHFVTVFAVLKKTVFSVSVFLQHTEQW